MIRVYDKAGNVIETHEHKGDFKRVVIAIKQEAGNRTFDTAIGRILWDQRALSNSDYR